MTDAPIDITVEQASVEVKTPPPAGIPMPDHPIRHHPAYQAFERLWRPAAGWVTVAGLLYAFIVGPATGKPLDDAYLFVELTFAAAMLGLKTFEKTRGVA